MDVRSYLALSGLQRVWQGEPRNAFTQFRVELNGPGRSRGQYLTLGIVVTEVLLLVPGED